MTKYLFCLDFVAVEVYKVYLCTICLPAYLQLFRLNETTCSCHAACFCSCPRLVLQSPWVIPYEAWLSLQPAESDSGPDYISSAFLPSENDTWTFLKLIRGCFYSCAHARNEVNKVLTAAPHCGPYPTRQVVISATYRKPAILPLQHLTRQP